MRSQGRQDLQGNTHVNANAFDEYFQYDGRKDLAAFSAVPTAKWLEMGEERAIERFRIAAASVPAHRNFLAAHGVEPDTIRTIDDFKTIDDFRRLPLTDKDSYCARDSLTEVFVLSQRIPPVSASRRRHFTR